MTKEGLSGRPDRSYAKPRDFNFALGIALLTALLHTIALAAEFFPAAESRALMTNTLSRLLAFIELCLLINVAGLWARRVAGLWVSLASLLLAGVGYVAWFAYSRQILSSLSSQLFYQIYTEATPPHPFGLVGATWLNLVVLVLSGMLLAWEAQTLRAMPRARD